ncbi:NlpC/P60 family protein [Nocardia brasiliensis]|uniref:NlpC/P60 family protein n=1 Tax=Nocardia brasiliensis TaxID=37326 RepID=UPI00245465EA|nr:NlpC/P60 family protein [Nocardia brasiliensis]
MMTKVLLIAGSVFAAVAAVPVLMVTVMLPGAAGLGEGLAQRCPAQFSALDTSSTELPSTATAATSSQAATMNPSAITSARVADQCVQALLTDAAAGPQGRQAAVLALDQVGLDARAGSGSLQGPTDGAWSDVELARHVVYAASAHSIVLPNSVAAQRDYGRHVDPRESAAGDLVFSAAAPGRTPDHVAVVLNPALVVDVAVTGGRVVVAAFPDGESVLVKRVLR